jgi:hypothetical protein
LGNHDDQLRYSDMEISYSVSVAEQTTGNAGSSSTTGATIAVGTGNSNSSTATGKIGAGAVNDVDITLSGLENGKTYTITANGDGGYKQSLAATIQVQDPDRIVYKALDDSESSYVELTVWSKGYTGAVEISYPSGLIPDNTDEVMRNVKSEDPKITDDSSFEDSTDTYNSHTYRFFKSSDDVSVTIDGFEVTYGESKAEIGTVPTKNQ